MKFNYKVLIKCVAGYKQTHTYTFSRSSDCVLFFCCFFLQDGWSFQSIAVYIGRDASLFLRHCQQWSKECSHTGRTVSRRPRQGSIESTHQSKCSLKYVENHLLIKGIRFYGPLARFSLTP